MARRRSPYVSASGMYRASRVPGEYYFLSFIINSIIVFCQLFWALIVFLISILPSVVEILISFVKICYHLIETFCKVSYEYLKPKFICIYEKLRLKYIQYQLRSSKWKLLSLWFLQVCVYLPLLTLRNIILVDVVEAIPIVMLAHLVVHVSTASLAELVLYVKKQKINLLLLRKNNPQFHLVFLWWFPQVN